ncbi:MAG TPA: hypothetical protein VGE01_00845, partial [Fimbriimonas sp.]
SSRAAFDVQVQYDWSGFLSPKASGVKTGRTVDVKFKLTGPSAGVENAAATLWIRRAGTAGFQNAGTFGFVSGAGRYEAGWNTSGYATGSYELKVDLGDGVERTTMITLR